MNKQNGACMSSFYFSLAAELPQGTEGDTVRNEGVGVSVSNYHMGQGDMNSYEVP